MPSLNFTAFVDVAPQVDNYGRLAEEALHKDPEVAVWRVRQVIESLVAWQEHLAGIVVERETLHRRIEDLRARSDDFGEVEALPRRLALKGLTAVRKQANDVVHVGGYASHLGGMTDASLLALRGLERVTVLGHRLLGQVVKFQVPPRPGVSDEVTHLTGELLFIESLINVDRDFKSATRRLEEVEPRVQALENEHGCPEGTFLELAVGCLAQRQRLANNDGRFEVGAVPAELRKAVRTRGSGTAREILVEIQNRAALQMVKLGRLDDAEQRTLELLELLDGQEPPADTSGHGGVSQVGGRQPTLVSGRLAGKILGTAGLVEQHVAHASWDPARARTCIRLFDDSGAWFSDAEGQYRAQVYAWSALVDTARFGGSLTDDEQAQLRRFMETIDPARLAPKEAAAGVYAFSVQLGLKIARLLKDPPVWITHLSQVLCDRESDGAGLLSDAPYPQVVAGTLLAMKPEKRPTKLLAALDRMTEGETSLAWVAHRYRWALNLADTPAIPAERREWYEALPAHLKDEDTDPLAVVPGPWL